MQGKDSAFPDADDLTTPVQNKLNPVTTSSYHSNVSSQSRPFTAHAATVILALSGCITVWADPSPENRGLMERVMNPDRNAPSSFQGKEFHPEGEIRGKSFKTSEFATGVSSGQKSFLTKPFAGIKDALFGRKEAPLKDLPESYRSDSRYVGKSFGSKDYATKDFSQSGKTARESSSAFETRQASVRGVAQGAFDNNPDLREAVKKGLSIEDIRKLLNKAP